MLLDCCANIKPGCLEFAKELCILFWVAEGLNIINTFFSFTLTDHENVCFLAHTDSSSDESESVAERVKMVRFGYTIMTIRSSA